MTGRELYKVVKKYFGYRARNVVYDSKTKVVSCLLYDSFFFGCHTNDRYGMFGGSIRYQKAGLTLMNFLGESCSLNSDKESICESLQLVDDYCRARLPDKFLRAYDKAYKKGLRGKR